MDFAKSRIGHVRIDLGRRNGRMSEKFLYRTDIRTVRKERRRERMPEGVRGHVLYDSGLQSAPRDHGGDEIPRKPNVFVGHGPFSTRAVLNERMRDIEVMPDEQRSKSILAGTEIFRNPTGSTIGQIHDAHLSAFSSDGELERFEIDSIPIQTGKLRDAESGGIYAFKNREIPLVPNVGSSTSVKYTFYLFRFQERDLPVMAFGKFNIRRIHRRFTAFLEKF